MAGDDDDDPVATAAQQAAQQADGEPPLSAAELERRRARVWGARCGRIARLVGLELEDVVGYSPVCGAEPLTIRFRAGGRQLEAACWDGARVTVRDADSGALLADRQPYEQYDPEPAKLDWAWLVTTTGWWVKAR